MSSSGITTDKEAVVVDGLEGTEEVGGGRRAARQKEISDKRKEKKKGKKRLNGSCRDGAVATPPTTELAAAVAGSPVLISGSEDSFDNRDNDECEDGGIPSVDRRQPPPPWEHDRQPPMQSRLQLTYCEVCGLPPSYCEFFPEAENCLRARASAAAADAAADDNRVSDECQPTAAAAAADVSKSNGGDSCEKPTAPPAETKKSSKKSQPPRVTIQSVSRSKKKAVTVIIGLDIFGVNLDGASKVFKKHFACGSSVSRGLPGKADHVEIQGDASGKLIEVLTKNFSDIPHEAIVILPPK